MNFRVVAGVGLGALIVPAVALAQGSVSDPASNWAAIAACGAIKDSSDRHDCMDDVLLRAGVLSTQRVAQEARQEFGKVDRPEPQREVAAVERPEASAVAPAQPDTPRRAADIDELVTTIASVRSAGYHRVRVTTAEGSVWDQTQAETFSQDPKPGDQFSIERASMGSFLCKFGRASRYRCARVD